MKKEGKKKEEIEKELASVNDEYGASAIEVAQLYERYQGTVEQRFPRGTALDEAASKFHEVGVKKRMLEQQLGKIGEKREK